MRYSCSAMRRGWVLGAVVAGLLALAAAGCATLGRDDWRAARRDTSSQAPDPATTPDAVVQVYAARTVGWKGAVAVHSWVVIKPVGAAEYTRYEVMGWGVNYGSPAIRVN